MMMYIFNSSPLPRIMIHVTALAGVFGTCFLTNGAKFWGPLTLEAVMNRAPLENLRSLSESLRAAVLGRSEQGVPPALAARQVSVRDEASPSQINQSLSR